MDIFSRGFKCAGVILFVCGCLDAVTITPLPYRGNEPGYRLPRGTAMFLDQEEGNRIRRKMMAEKDYTAPYGGSNRYFGNEIDRDVYNEERSRDYYPNYNPDGSSSNTWGEVAAPSAHDCYPRGQPYDNNAISGHGWVRNGYANQRGNDNRQGMYIRNKARGYEKNSKGYQQRYDTSRNDFIDAWDRRYYGSIDRDGDVGEGTVGFYGRARRP